MTVLGFSPHVVSVTDAAKSGLPKLLRDVELGEDVVVERHGKAVAAVVSMRHLDEIRRLEADLRETALLLSRVATDSGRRTDLDDVLTTFGFDRAELEAELDADLAAGRG
jgi:prevent-host-death family protein